MALVSSLHGREFARILALWPLLSLLLLGCAVEAAPDLLDVRDVGPSSLEAGSTLELAGAGFPERQAGLIILRGSVFAPARATRNAEVSWPARASSRSRVEVELTKKLISAFTEGAAHVTFRGTLSVEFAAPRAGGPLLRGESTEVVLDFFDRAVTDAAPAPQSFASFLGIELNETLEITTVLADSEAAHAGLLPGDHLRALDGLRLDSATDFFPAAGGEVSSLEFSRPGHRDAGTALLDRSAYQPLALSAAARALMVVFSALGALVLASHPPRWLVWLLARRPARAIPPPLGRAPGLSALTRHVCFLTVIVASWFILGRVGESTASQHGGWFDLELLLSLGFVSLLVSSFLAAGRRSGARSLARFSIWSACTGALGALVLLLPALIATALRATETGSLRLCDLARAQGAGPLDWALVDSPWSLLLGLAFLGSLVPAYGRRTPLEARRSDGPVNGTGADLLAWFGLVVLTAVWVMLFLGGAQGAAAGGVLGGLLLSAKVSLTLLGVLAARRALGHLRSGESFGFWGPGLFSCTTAGSALFGLSLASSALDSHWELMRQGVALLVVASLLLLALAASRALSHAGRTVDPWI